MKSTITDVWWDRENPKIGDELSFSYKVKNQGYNTKEFTNALYIDGERWDISSRSSLKAGETSDRFFTRIWKTSAGLHEIKVVVDDLGEIDEGNEKNNQFVKTLKIVMLEGRVISGTSGNGISDATVSISPGGMTATTQENGYYSFLGVPEGKYTIMVGKKGYIFDSVIVDVTNDKTTLVETIKGEIDKKIINAEISKEPKRGTLDATYVIGDHIYVTYGIKNVGTIEYTFYAGYSVIAKGEDKYWDAPYDVVTLKPGEEKEITLFWRVQPNATREIVYDDVIAVWGTQQNTLLYDNLDKKEYKNSFKVIEGDKSVSGWYLYNKEERKVTVNGIEYTAIPASSNGKNSWLIKNNDGKVEKDITIYKHAAEAADLSVWMEPCKLCESNTKNIVNALREVRDGYNEFNILVAIGKLLLWFRDTAAYLLTKFSIIAVTGGSSLTVQVPAEQLIKESKDALIEELASKLSKDILNTPRALISEKTINKILLARTVGFIDISASKLDKAIKIIEDHESNKPWSYEEANEFHTNYAWAVIEGQSNIVFARYLQPGSDLSSQLRGVSISAIEAIDPSGIITKVSIKGLKDGLGILGDSEAMINYATERAKYVKIIDDMQKKFNEYAEEIQKASLSDTDITIDIVYPLRTVPAFAGSNTNPNNIDVLVDVKDGETSVTDLSNDDFSFEIGEKSAKTNLFATPGPGSYKFEVTPPTQETAGKYDLEVTITYSGKNFAVTKQDAVEYISDTTEKIDVIFIIDTTNSMADDIEKVKLSANQIVEALASETNDYRVALVDYRDYPQSPYGKPGLDYVYKLDLPFSNNKDTIIKSINALSLGDGMDHEESVYTALVKAMTDPAKDPSKADNHGWRKGVKKAIILMGDAPPHEPEPWKEAYSLKDVVFWSVNIDPVITYSVVIGNNSSASNVFSNISESTGGKTYYSPNASDIVETIIEVIGDINETGEGRLITTNFSDQGSPSISGNTIVWKDKKNGNSDIYMYDLSTSTEKRITTNTANQLYPVISGNRIVWEDKRNGNSDIYMYDLSTSTEKQITTNSAHQWYPDISGNRIVWQDKRNGNWDIYMYDLFTSTEKQITTDSKYQTSPSISENRIVWQDYRNGNWDIYMYDLSTSTEKQITTNTANQASPSISGNYIVWKDNRNGNWDIYMYDLSTSTEEQITTDSANKRNPAISGNNIVWQDHRNGGWDIYIYDLSANTEKRLTTNSAIQSNPSISGNNIVWQDYRNGNWDIYMTDLSI